MKPFLHHPPAPLISTVQRTYKPIQYKLGEITHYRKLVGGAGVGGSLNKGSPMAIRDSLEGTGISMGESVTAHMKPTMMHHHQ